MYTVSNNAAAALAQQRRVCEPLIQLGVPAGASVETLQAYAECVRVVHPREMGAAEFVVLGIAAAIILAMIGIAVRAWWESRL